MKSYKKGLLAICINLIVVGVFGFVYNENAKKKVDELTSANLKMVVEQNRLNEDLESTKKELKETKYRYDKYRNLYEEEIKPVKFNK
ncbi:hypothetical protein UT300003_33000 [Clostridium sardiniense]